MNIDIKKLGRVQFIGLLVTLAGLLMHLADNSSGKFLLAAGAILIFVYRFLLVIKAKNFEERRLMRIFMISPLVLIGAAYSMYVGGDHWKALLLVVAILDIYVSYRGDKR